MKLLDEKYLMTFPDKVYTNFHGDGLTKDLCRTLYSRITNCYASAR